MKNSEHFYHISGMLLPRGLRESDQQDQTQVLQGYIASRHCLVRQESERHTDNEVVRVGVRRFLLHLKKLSIRNV